MRVKTFRGESITAVLAQVRQELGPEAVILSNQTIREEGASLCEVMAALEQPTPPPSPPQQEEETGSIAALYRQAAQPVSPTSPGQTADWKREWGEIKGHLLALLRPRLDFSALTPRQRLALEYLEREGVDEGSVLALYRTIIERGEQTVIPALSRLVRVKALTTESWPRTAHMFVGPSGVGKTSTVLRMALAARRRAPEERVLVVNTDTTRSKGRLLLRHYAELSGLSYEEANGPEDFKRIFEAAAKGETVFVDTPSLCGEGAIAEWSLEMGLAGRKGLAAHLVLSPMFASGAARRKWPLRSVRSLIARSLRNSLFGRRSNPAGLPLFSEKAWTCFFRKETFRHMEWCSPFKRPLANTLDTADLAISQPHLDAPGMKWRFGQNIFDDSFGECAGTLILFQNNGHGQSRPDIGPLRSVWHGVISEIVEGSGRRRRSKFLFFWSTEFCLLSFITRLLPIIPPAWRCQKPVWPVNGSGPKDREAQSGQYK